VRLPRAEDAVVDLGKLRDYVLSAEHPRGRHKARVFRSSLAIGAGDAAWLRAAILDAVRAADAAKIDTDRFGSRWRTDLAIVRGDRHAVVRCIWLVPPAEGAPRLVTCYVL